MQLKSGQTLNEIWFPILFYAFVSFIIMIPLLGPGYYLALDMQFGPNSFSNFQFQSLYGFSTSAYGGYLPLQLALAALSHFIPIDILEKCLLFCILFLCGISAHFSLPKEFGYSRYFAGLLYMLNPFVFLRFIVGHWQLLLSYAIFPLALRTFLSFLEKTSDRNRFVSAALLTAVCAISSHGILLLLLIYLIFFIVFSFKKKPTLYDLGRLTLLAITVIVLNLFWVVPTLLQYGNTFQPASAAAYLADFGAKGGNLPLPLAILTMHGFWRGGVIYTKDVFSLWYVPYIAMLILCLIGCIYLWRSDRYTLVALLAVSLSSLFLAMGTSSPIYGMLSIVNNAFPVYFIFRDTQKFVALLPLAYAWLGAYGLHFLSLNAKRFKPIIISIALLAVIIHNYGFFGLLGQIGPTQYPSSWSEADHIIASDPTPGNIVILPFHLYYWYTWSNGVQKTLGNPASQFFSKPVIGPTAIESTNVNSDVNDTVGNYLSFLFSNRQFINNTAEMLLPLDIRYVIIIRTDQDSTHYLYLFQRLGGMKNIELVYESDDLYVFKNDLATGQFMSSSENASSGFDAILNNSGKGIYSPNVTYSMVTPAEFNIYNSSFQYTIFSFPASKYLLFNGLPVSSWHSLSSSFVVKNSGTLSNQLFYYTLALFLLSWLICLILLMRPGVFLITILIVSSIVIFFAASYGILDPSGMGSLLILSFTIVVIHRSVDAKNNTFLNVI